MKVTHITTHDAGGAATAAYRLHQGLLATGIESSFLVLYNTGKFPDAITFSARTYHFLAKKLLRRLNAVQDRSVLDDRIEIFTSPDTLYDVRKSKLVCEADIIHLHWVSNFIDYQTFFKELNKRIVWTFHDLNPIHGGFHYNLDLTYANSALLALDRKYLELKLTALKANENITCICPSMWMKQEIEKSPFKKVFNHCHVIHYGLDSTKQLMIDRLEARRTLNLNPDKTIFLIIATNLKNFRKGFDLILPVIEKLQGEQGLEFLIVGSLNDIPRYSNVNFLGSVEDFTKLNVIYNAVDAVVLSSREDNLPNVMLEALMCGTPLVGFAVGGIKDTVTSLNGVVSEGITIDSLLGAIRRFIALKHTFNRNKIRENAIHNFDVIRQNEQVTNLYETVINQNNK